ncbi:hypothetical protein SDRG_17244 [Saprolegnia diclina VS20]|uniref:Uncharacterized protein n=1 Tax=Saprolegnia diclina (strain VS20) TaxID=1156394 RepID=T0PRN8_SAPDV|nr:hypothetical protein SDRG_17244 [Saprolegnia diclina VS20]EQC24866.1 hypothetical protein SDRG_17244 [Saprolegnia diclina VS20]|eukprot:XP_008621706.1 hypothetical protein SDRG_17244 [Saprolegnia diclina VS20]
MTSVMPLQTAGPATPHHVVPVAWHTGSLVVSVLLCLNVVSTPLKAYLCEALPWQIDDLPELYESSTTPWTTKEAHLLAFFSTLYNNDTLSPRAVYFTDVRTSTVGYRAHLRRPQAVSNCDVDVLTAIDGGLFVAEAARNTFCAYVATPPSNASTMGSCFATTVLRSVEGYVCIWSVLADDAPRLENDARIEVLYTGFRLHGSSAFLWFKLVYRSLLTFYLVYLVWRHYYAHYRTLRAQCRHLPHATRCLLLVGDPTSIVLLHPLVCFGLVVDTWLSVNMVGVEIMALLQLRDLWQFALGYFYLSRCVWFCYAFLAIASAVLKRYHIEHSFSPVDPTLVAVAATLVVGPMTYLQGHSALIQVYSWLLNVSANSPHATEGIYAIFVYTISIGLLPIGYGVLHRQCRRTPTSANAVYYAAFWFNDWKHRVLLHLEALFLGLGRIERRTGGSIYAVFARYPDFKQSPCISQRGADAYVVIYDATGPVECKRLSLLASVDARPHHCRIEIVRCRGTQVFGHLELQTSKATGMVACVAYTSLNGDSPWLE